MDKNYKKRTKNDLDKNIKQDSPNADKPNGQCRYYKKCGGCQLQNMDYARQLSWKQARVEILIKKFGRVEKIIGMKNPFHYRNKVSAAFSTDRYGKTISGVYQASTHRIVAIDRCMIEDKKADEIIVSIRKMMEKFKIQPYNEYKGTGSLRHILIKRGFKTGEIMVVLVMKSSMFPLKKHFVRALTEMFPEIKTVILNINPDFTSMVLGKREEILYGKGYIEDELCGCKFRISAKSFYQINPIQTEILYRKAIEFADLTGKETVIDAYCGIGTIGMVAAKNGAENVVGVELNKDAVKDAISNAKLNGMENIYFYNADAGDFMRNMAAEGKHADVVFMDPPRAGSDIKFLSSVVSLNPERIVYISCNPETLARDLEYLTKYGYEVKMIQPVDMFPFTNHVECVCLMTRKAK